MHWKVCIRNFYATAAQHKSKVPNNLKNKSKSSQEWITRQINDPYVEKAKMLNYSAFKLIEIDDKHNILKPGNVVLDCGAAPGSWTQIAVRKTNADKKCEEKQEGLVIGIDLLQIYPIEGAHLLGNLDFRTEVAQRRIKELLDNKLVNCVLSDMAPNATGVKTLDQENITSLCYTVLRFACLMSAPGASLLVKIWDNGDVPQLEKDMQRFYRTVKCIKPNASRSDSAEKFLLAKEFVGLKDIFTITN